MNPDYGRPRRRRTTSKPAASPILIVVKLTRPKTGSVLNLEVTSAEHGFLAERYPGWVIN